MSSSYSYATVSDSPYGGAFVYRNTNAGVTGAVAKAAPGRLYGAWLVNAASALRYVKVYDKATAPTQSDTPVMTLALNPTSGTSFNLAAGVSFVNGISLRASTGVADSDTGAPTANDVLVNLFYA